MLTNRISTLVKQFRNTAALALAATVAIAGLASAQTPFVISSVSSGQVLDDKAFSTTPGTILQQWPANGGKNQQWKLRRQDNSVYYEIISEDSGLALAPRDGSTTPGTKIQQSTVNGSPSQLWTFSGGSMGYQIVSQQLETVYCYRGPDCLGAEYSLLFDVTDSSTEAGAEIQQWTTNGKTNQLWRLHPQNQRL